MKKRNIFDYLLVGIQFVLSVFVLVTVRNLIPSKFLIPMAVVLLLLVCIIGLMLLAKKKAKWFNRILSVLISIALAIVSFTAYTGVSTIDRITDTEDEINQYSIVVLNDSDIKGIEDLEGKKIGIFAGTNLEEHELIKQQLEEKITFIEVTFNSVDDMQKALFNKEIDAMILNEAFRPIIEEINEKFSESTKKLDEYDIKASESTETVEPIEKEEGTTDGLVHTSNKHAVDVTKEGFNVYITGIDTYGPIGTRSRSDVNMVLTINPNSHTIVMTSIPRDYYVTLASFGAKDKLTHSGLYGPNETLRTIENLMGININYYARVNFTSLETIVNALGGITVNNPVQFSMGNKVFPVGTQDLNGHDALLFSRARKTLSGGDSDRILNQQRVLTGILNKAMSPAIIYNYSTILNAVAGSLDTNMSSNEIQSLIQMQINDMRGWNFISQSVWGTGTTSTTCYSYRGPALYVSVPNMEVVSQCANVIRQYSY